MHVDNLVSFMTFTLTGLVLIVICKNCTLTDKRDILLNQAGSRDNMAAPAAWDEHQAYEELLYWDSLIQQGHRLLPHDFDRYKHTHTHTELVVYDGK